MKYGLSEECLALIAAVFSRQPAVQRVMLYGSRALGTYHPGSDIDLAVSGIRLSFNDLLQLAVDLDELDFLYSFDLQHLEKIQNPELLAHINRVGIPVYEASRNVALLSE